MKLTLNFFSPYCATSMGEFWRRWHITLSQWFRDYLYIQLGGGRVRWWAFNVALVFIVSGIWHGAGWNFVLWGRHPWPGADYQPPVPRQLKLPAFLAWLLTMLTSFGAWLGFYETHTHSLALKMKALFTPQAYGAAAWREAAGHCHTANGFVMACFLALAGIILLLEWLSIARRDTPFYFLQRPKVLVVLVALTVLLAPEKNNGFIYFAF